MKILGYIVLGLFVFIVIATLNGPSPLEERLDEAHEFFNSPNRKMKVSDLPRPGVTRGDDYKNCMRQKYYRDQADPEDFCRWHAGMGKYFKK